MSERVHSSLISYHYFEYPSLGVQTYSLSSKQIYRQLYIFYRTPFFLSLAFLKSLFTIQTDLLVYSRYKLFLSNRCVSLYSIDVVLLDDGVVMRALGDPFMSKASDLDPSDLLRVNIL